jgi:hypothetical protein
MAAQSRTASRPSGALQAAAGERVMTSQRAMAARASLGVAVRGADAGEGRVRVRAAQEVALGEVA